MGVHDNAHVNRDLRKNSGVQVTPEAVRKMLTKNHFHGRTKVRKPLLTNRDRFLRLNFAKKTKISLLMSGIKLFGPTKPKSRKINSGWRQWV